MSLYGQDLAYIQAIAFGDFARATAPEIVRLLNTAAIPIRHVVDLGCGAGVLSASLVDAGFDVTAVDSSADLLAIASGRVPRARFVKASIYDFEFPDCEALVAIGEPLTYHADIADADRLLEKVLRDAAGVLPAGGMLMFDVIETGEPSLTGRVWSSGVDWAVLADIREDPAFRTLIRNIETFRQLGNMYRRGHETHRVRLFNLEELAAMLAGCGFAAQMTRAYGGERLPAAGRLHLHASLVFSVKDAVPSVAGPNPKWAQA
jgi:SAM-dependent methyltransferase